MLSASTLLASALALAPLASAIQFKTVPVATPGNTVTVSWDSVDTDPASFSLYLWNFALFPPYYAPVAFDVATAKGSATVRVPCSLPGASDAYQFSAINGTNVYVILAQTDKFALGAATCADPTGVSTGCAAGATMTVTETVTLGTNKTTKTQLPGNATTGWQPTGSGGTGVRVTATSTPSLAVSNAGSVPGVTWGTLGVVALMGMWAGI